MQNSSLKKHLFYIIVTAVFLISIPHLACRAANQSTVSKAGLYMFDKGTTVEMLQEKLDSQSHPLKVEVLRADGSKKNVGLLENGDIVRILDKNGNVLSTVTAAIKSDGGSSSSQTGSSSPSGESPSSGESVPSSENVGPSLPSDGGDYVFSGKTTVEELSKIIYSMPAYKNYEIKVKAYGGKQKQNGLICTGDTMALLSADGKEAGSATAIVPGDLTRCGEITRKGCDMLYGYLAHSGELKGDILRAADMNGDGIVDTSDLLLMKLGRRQSLFCSQALQGAGTSTLFLQKGWFSFSHVLL